MCGFGIILVFAGSLMRWRLDEHGVQPLRNVWKIMGFNSKSYGLLTVHAKETRSWQLITHEVCDWAGMKGAQLSTYIQAGVGGGCDGAEDCSQGLADHLYTRCKEYNKIYIVNFAVLGFTFLGCLLGLIGILIGILRPLHRGGGITYGMLLFSGFSMLILDIVWAVTTWNAFSNLGDTAWYPFPSLALGWFLHIYGSVTILVSARVFGWLVMPLVRAFDPEQQQLEDRIKKMEKMNLWSQEQAQMQMHQQQYPVHAQGVHPGQHAYYNGGANVANSYQYPAGGVQDYQGGANLYGAPMAQMPAQQMTASQV